MKEKLKISQNLLIGSLLFGLFFGAGNLIFPVKMGQDAGANSFVAGIGFIITGVGLPIVGIIASALSRSDSLLNMTEPVGKKYSLAFTAILYLTIGPLFAIPRTATVAFEVGIRPFVSDFNANKLLIIFSVVFFLLTLYYSLKPGKILDWIGKFLTPTFLVLLSILLLMTFIKPMGNAADFTPVKNYIGSAFFTGLLDGYNTMDALASLAFAIIIISNIRNLGINDPSSIAIETSKSGLVSVVGMTVIYGSLTFMGATSLGAVERADNGGLILSYVSSHYFGYAGQMLLAAIVIIACLKTAIGLITACSEMFVEITHNKISYKIFAVLFVLFSFIMANFGLNNIISLSVPVLMFLYPLAITLIVLSLLYALIKKNGIIYKSTMIFTFFAAIFDFFKALPENIKDISFIKNMIEFAKNYLPGFNYGFGWIVPAVIGFFIGVIINRIINKRN
ncbi:branched-chain amino acid transport system II carrier protein [Clostridium sp. BJN0001]|uniref:branched-chain amino acid transport system II carrier protein n=1 Tax=Clostridium sp. BJN0001 TaxID=2930219 RepID=UPI001FD5A193|nr:branched-chain amino acid transport system II carrier protein [Clostridium sp. BJN0001]